MLSVKAQTQPVAGQNNQSNRDECRLDPPKDATPGVESQNRAVPLDSEPPPEHRGATDAKKGPNNKAC